MPGTRFLRRISWTLAAGFCAGAQAAEPARSAASAVATAAVAAVSVELVPGVSLFVLVGLGLLIVLAGWRLRMRFIPNLPMPKASPAAPASSLGGTSQVLPSTRAEVVRARPLPGPLDPPDTGPASYAALPEGGGRPLSADPVVAEEASLPEDFPVAEGSDAWAEVLATDSLVDVEQQADFFLAVGQDEAAKALLAEALDGAPTPRLHLKLADILSRHADREAWEALRLRTEARFNLAMPAWDALAGPDRGLEAHPLALARLVAIWPNPLRAAATLGKSLLRPAEGHPARQRFDLSAYRELMLLHAIACDVARQVAVTEVDIELPLSEDGPNPA